MRVNDNSSEDEDTVVVNSARMRSAGFTDFDDVGGFESSSGFDDAAGFKHDGQTSDWSDLWSASAALNMVDVSLRDDSPNSMEDSVQQDSPQQDDSDANWNAFQDPSDPTDLGERTSYDCALVCWILSMLSC